MFRWLPIFFLLLSTHSFAQRGGEVESRQDSVRNNYALVVGISNYQNIKPLIYADDDAEAFANLLIEQEICERKNVKRLIDSQATAANFYLELERFLTRLQPNDRLFIYFAGHGDVENKIQAGFLLCWGTRPSPYAGSDVIDLNMLENYVNAFTANNTKVVLITDACRSGNLAGGLAGVSNTLTSINKRFQNVVKMLSCQPNQLSQEKLYPGGGHGVFTYHLLNGLYGLADKDGDKKISLRELDRYLDEVGIETNDRQIPKIDGDPQIKLVSYNETLKQLALARIKNTDVAGSKINDRNRNDTSWNNNKYYLRFRKAIQDLYLTGIDPGSAEFTVMAAEMNQAPADMIADMKLELASVLEDQLQKWLNIYLRGEADSKKSTCYQCLTTMSDYANLLEKLTPKQHLRYKEIHAKNIFFNVYQRSAYRKLSEYSGYIDALKEADSLVPDQPWLQQIMGTFYSELRRYDEARKYFAKAIALAPKWSYPHISRGITYLDNLYYESAERDFKQAIALDPTLALTLYDLGLTYERQYQYDRSDSCYRKAVQTDSSYGPAWTALARHAIRELQYDEAEHYLKMAEAADSLEYSVYTTRGRLYEKLKKFGEAETSYRKAATIGYYETSAVSQLGYFLYDQGRYDEAYSIFMKCYELDSLDRYALRWIAKCLIKTGLPYLAETWLEKAVVLDKEAVYTYADLGDLYAGQKKFTSAERAYKEIFKYDKHANWAYAELANIYVQNKMFDQAKESYYKTTQSYQTSFNVEITLGRISLLAGETDSAIIHAMLALTNAEDTTKAAAFADSLLLNEKYRAIKLAVQKLESKDYAAAELYFTRLHTVFPGDREIIYLFASSLAAASKQEQALQKLKEAIEKGFADKNRILSEKYFDSIKQTAAFRSILDSIK